MTIRPVTAAPPTPTGAPVTPARATPAGCRPVAGPARSGGLRRRRLAHLAALVVAATLAMPALASCAVVSTPAPTTRPGVWQAAVLPTFAGVLAPGPTPPVPPAGARVVPVASAGELVAALAAALPGDVIEVAAGTYQGEFTAAADGTAQQPIVVRPQAAAAVSFGGTTSFVVSGDWVVIQGFEFTALNDRIIRLEGTAGRVTGNRFTEAGSGANGEATGLIYLQNQTPGWSTGGDADGRNAPIVAQHHLIDGNTFVRPRNTPIWQDHGLQGNRIVRNTFTGPFQTQGSPDHPAEDTPVIKIGWGFGTDAVDTEVGYNTITGWGAARPYVMGIKGNGVNVHHNFLDSGRLMVRQGDRAVFEANVIADGDLILTGAGHRVVGNFVRTRTSVDGFGPITFIARSSKAGYDGADGRPQFYREVTGTTVERNTFVSSDAAEVGSFLVLVYGDAPSDHPPVGNTITANVFARQVNPDRFVIAAGNWPDRAVAAAAATWSGNVFHCYGGCTDRDARLPAGIVGRNANVVGDPGTAATRAGIAQAAPAPPSTTVRRTTGTTRRRSAGKAASRAAPTTVRRSAGAPTTTASPVPPTSTSAP